MKTRRISEVITQTVASIDVDERLTVALELMEKEKIQHLPVTKNSRLVGMLALEDIQQLEWICRMDDVALEDHPRYRSMTVEELMVPEVASIKPDATVDEAMELFVSSPYDSVPVTNNGKLEGIIKASDLWRSSRSDDFDLML